ncbi:MAG TPA: NUDIX domain-containing protein [Pyrinomonadaceae bacterium]|jgi:8-oxo-dGTP diphosphatase
MVETHTFGSQKSFVDYTERRAAYVVIYNDDGKVALVRGKHSHFLPGGGADKGESPEDTITREVREELARSVRLIRPIGEAIQYFYSSTDDRHYRMQAIFFTGEFTDEATDGAGEHELDWLPLEEAEHACFHACHAWAVKEVMSAEY